MSEFSLAPLGELAEFINGDRGKNYPSKSDFADQGIPFINAGHLTDGGVGFAEMNYISEERFRKLGSGKTKANDLLYCLRGSLGKTAIVRHKGNAAIASSLVIIRPNEECSVEYLYRYLTSPFGEAEIRRFDNGSSQPNLSATNVKKYQIPLPPITEQKRIAKILDAADALRAKRRESLAQLDILLQSTFLELFGDPVTNPKGWEKPHLQNLCHKVIDCPHSTPRWSKSGVICLRTSNLGKGEWNWVDTRFVTKEDYNERTKRSEILPSDIILSREGTVGVLALVNEGMRLCMGQRLVQLRVNDSQLHPKFLLNLLLHELAPERISRLMAGSTSKHLNVRELRKLPIPTPPLPLQHRFATIVESIEQQRARLRAHLTELDTLFASLQQRAFNGEL